jgi:hypothetical protein
VVRRVVDGEGRRDGTVIGSALFSEVKYEPLKTDFIIK